MPVWSRIHNLLFYLEYSLGGGGSGGYGGGSSVNRSTNWSSPGGSNLGVFFSLALVSFTAVG
ncbi:hypothetical protein I79_009985 [Cricetulus griseus]|uniref:Uncharacterized protein n=1 Tax=Cricetulus griseus TaxID=10029 RepID=G3HH87_CRIGR|nr:hypothetical protein I79_009985 [Cricetulus griseus]